MRNVLLIAGLDERYYYGPFVEACRERDVRIYIFDPSKFPDKVVVGMTLNECGQVTGFVDVLLLNSEEPEHLRLPIQNIDIAWYIRESATALKAAQDPTSIEEQFRENESRAMIRSFLSILDCVWINKKETIDFLASNKLYQQLLARQSDLITPRTLVSNDPESVTAFSSEHNGLLLKSLGYISLDDEGRCFLYSQRFSHEELVGSSVAIRNCPIFSQEYVEKRYEHRVMVIGDCILSCRIDSQASEVAKEDWRHYDFDNVEHVQSHLPQDIQRKLLRFMASVGLRYGAIDLIETPEGDFVFLEVNPSGQWGWIADFAGLSVPEAVADMLESLEDL